MVFIWPALALFSLVYLFAVPAGRLRFTQHRGTPTRVLATVFAVLFGSGLGFLIDELAGVTNVASLVLPPVTGVMAYSSVRRRGGD